MQISKKKLFYIAALVWTLAACKVLDIGFFDLLKDHPSVLFNTGFAILGCLVFFRLAFLNVLLRNIKRVVRSAEDKLPAWAFFDRKGYITMVFMISLGFFIRKLPFIPEVYLGTFYLVIGFSLLAGALSFVYAGLKYDYMESKHGNCEQI